MRRAQNVPALAHAVSGAPSHRRRGLPGGPGTHADLTKLEFDVLQYLHEREGRVVSRAALLGDVWGYDWSGGSNVVEVVISALRRNSATVPEACKRCAAPTTGSPSRPDPRSVTCTGQAV